MAADHHSSESMDYRTELLSPSMAAQDTISTASDLLWQLDIDMFKLPHDQADRNPGVHNMLLGLTDMFSCLQTLLHSSGKRRKIAEYYKRQEKIVQGLSELQPLTETGSFPGTLTEDEARKLAKGETFAIRISNIANVMLLIVKIYASIETRSMAVIASTLDSLLDVLSGFILWFTAHAMKKPNPNKYPVGKTRMQPVGIVVFAAIMATLGLQILFESARQLIIKAQPERNPDKEKWMIAIMVTVTVIKFMLMIYCRRFRNDIVRAYAQDHFFDVVTNTVSLATAVLAIKFYWWIDPTGAIIIALYTISTWARTVLENVWSLIGRSAPPEYLAKLIYLTWNHHEKIKKIEAARAYRLGRHYFVEVDIVLPGNMLLSQAHNIGDTLQDKLEQLPEVERAFVHVDYEFTHKPEHQPKG